MQNSFLAKLSIAAVTGLRDGLPTWKGHWLRADPVELRADLAAVYLLGAAQISPLATQITALEQLLAQDGLTLHMPHPRRWYLQMDRQPQITSFSPGKARGKDIGNYLPQETYWRRLFTEIQMLLHTDVPGAANALWFWGA